VGWPLDQASLELERSRSARLQEEVQKLQRQVTELDLRVEAMPTSPSAVGATAELQEVGRASA
jgi:hypothetical protein